VSELSGKVALVTGASRGIGRAIAVALASAGADVAVNYRKEAGRAEEVSAKIRSLGRKTLPVQADVSRASEVERMAHTVEKDLGIISVLVNNAGIAQPRLPEKITESDWNEMIRVNLTSVFVVTQRVLPAMRAQRWGRIINLSSVAAQVGGIVGPHYAASKAGILGLTHSYASLLAKEGITVNTIAPALIETDMIRENPSASPERIPVGFFGPAYEVGRIAVMLAESSYITGQTIHVNGGWYMS